MDKKTIETIQAKIYLRNIKTDRIAKLERKVPQSNNTFYYYVRYVDDNSVELSSEDDFINELFYGKK